MKATFHERPYDPAVAEIVKTMKQGLMRMRDAMQAAPEGGVDMDALRFIPQEQFKPLYALARALCNEEKFRLALPIAMQLAMHSNDSRYAYLAGACMQRLGHPEFAASMFSACLFNDAKHIAAMFRLGECFAALGDAEQAVKSFESVVDIGRADMAHRPMQDKADAKLEKLRPAVQKRKPARAGAKQI